MGLDQYAFYARKEDAMADGCGECARATISMKKQVTYSLIFACPGIDENGFEIRTFKHLFAAVAAFTKDYNGCIKSENLKIQGENLAKLDEGHAYADFGDITLYLRKVEME